MGYPQQPPPQQPPDRTGVTCPVTPVTPAMESIRRVSGWPAGHGVATDDSLIGRDTSKVDSQVWQRYS